MELKTIDIELPVVPNYFWMVTQSPPKETNLLDIALEHKEFTGLNKTTGDKYLIERCDFFIYKHNEPIQYYLSVMALNMEPKEARDFLTKKYGKMDVVFWFFKVKGIMNN
jgi:hypothetical protein